MSNDASSGALKSGELLQGIGGSPGVAFAPAFVLRARLLEVPERRLTATEVAAEQQRLAQALETTRRQLRALRDRLGARTDTGNAGILDAHLMVLDDEQFAGQVRNRIAARQENAEWAVQEVAKKLVQSLAGAGDRYLAERSDDLADVARRLLRNLLGLADSLPEKLEKPCIVVAESLTPSEAAALPRDRVLGLILDRGSYTSHAALIARALEIPAVFGLGDLSDRVRSGDPLVLDGNKGVVIVNPSQHDLDRFHRLAIARQGVQRELESRRDLPAITPDGRRIHLLANIESVDDLGSVVGHGAEGVGLFRTEYLWLTAGHAVGEEEQTRIYRRAVETLAGHPVIIRVFDLGGDKFLGNVGLRREDNPFLGLRSIRYLLRHPEVFKAQLRAILRARAHGDVRLLYPMISDVGELRRANEILADCQAEVAAEGGGAANGRMPVGAMIEIPSAALTADLLAEQVDFFSLGTNDLIQYTLAVDRINEHVVHLYQPAHPAVLRLIEQTIAAGHRRNIPVGVCGEMAADPLLAVLLLGMGIDELSMAPAAVPAVKDVIRRTPLEEAAKLAARARTARSAAETLHACRKLLERVAPELLTML